MIVLRLLIATSAWACAVASAGAQAVGPPAPTPPPPSREDCADERATLDEEEIVVCAQYEEGERYRVPRELRDRLPVPGGQSWSGRAADAAAFLRNEDQVSGAGAASGYTRDQDARWRAERADRRRRQREVEQAVDPNR